MRFRFLRTPQHITNGAKQAMLLYRIHLVELSLLPLGATDVFDDFGIPLEWTQEEIDKNQAELEKVNAELDKF